MAGSIQSDHPPLVGEGSDTSLMPDVINPDEHRMVYSPQGMTSEEVANEPEPFGGDEDTSPTAPAEMHQAHERLGQQSDKGPQRNTAPANLESAIRSQAQSIPSAPEIEPYQFPASQPDLLGSNKMHEHRSGLKRSSQGRSNDYGMKTMSGGSLDFKVQWLCVERLPFYKIRHIRNPWNSDREVKISRDGTELEPGVGKQLLDEWREFASTVNRA